MVMLRARGRLRLLLQARHLVEPCSIQRRALCHEAIEVVLQLRACQVLLLNDSWLHALPPWRAAFVRRVLGAMAHTGKL